MNSTLKYHVRAEWDTNAPVLHAQKWQTAMTNTLAGIHEDNLESTVVVSLLHSHLVTEAEVQHTANILERYVKVVTNGN